MESPASPEPPPPGGPLSWATPAALASSVLRGYERWRSTRFTLTERQRLFGLTVAIGGVCGLIAVVFHHSIGFLERLTVDAAAAAEDGLPWLVVIPMAGALCAGLLLLVVPGARGSGIPQVKLAYASKSFRIRFRDVLGKYAIGTLQVGTGSSLGREGPTVFICSGIAAGMGKLAGVSAHNLKLLLPVGTAAGIAAAFNAPIAAVTFTIEEIIGQLEQTLLTGVIVAAALAAVVARSLSGDNPVFSIPQGYGLDHPSSLVIYVGLGLAAALVSVAFTDSLLWVRARFSRSKHLPVWSRPAIGGLVTGGLAAGALWLLGVGGVTGAGYHSLVQALSGTFTVDTLLILGGLKLIATVFSYSSGGAGGIFAPTLFIGAMLGGAFGALDIEVFGHGHAELGSFALVGMGAVFAGTIRAPITSVLIIMEMTGGYGLTLPLMISNMIAFAIARRLRPTQIYEAFLVQDGIDIHPPRPVETLDGVTIERVELEREPRTFAPGDPASLVVKQLVTAGRQEVFPVIDRERRLVGIITLDDITSLAAESSHLEGLVCAADLMRKPLSVRGDDAVQRALDRMAALDARQLPVLDLEDRIAGLVDEAAIAHELLRVHAEGKEAAAAAAAADPGADLADHDAADGHDTPSG